MLTPPDTLTIHPDGTRTVRISRLRQRLLEAQKPNYVIAALAGIHPYSLSLYVQGKRAMQPRHLRNLSEVLDSPPEELLGWVSFHLTSEGKLLSGPTNVEMSDSPTVRQSDRKTEN